MKTKAYFNWSSGKDSALALYRALNRFDIKALLTVIDSTNNRIPMHGTNLDLLKAQSQSIGIPLVTCDINTEYSEDKYKISLQEIIDKFKSQEISTALFGDIHLLELKIGREEKCRQAGLKTDFPLWNNSPQELLHEFIDSGFKAIITCIDGSVLDKTFVGRMIDYDFINDLPDGVDICGENGEYLSFVFDGPIFKEPVPYHLGPVSYKEYPCQDLKQNTGFWYIDIYNAP